MAEDKDENTFVTAEDNDSAMAEPTEVCILYLPNEYNKN